MSVIKYQQDNRSTVEPSSSVKSKYLLVLNKTVRKTITRRSSIYPAGCAMFGLQEPSVVLGLYLVPWQIK